MPGRYTQTTNTSCPAGIGDGDDSTQGTVALTDSVGCTETLPVPEADSVLEKDKLTLGADEMEPETLELREIEGDRLIECVGETEKLMDCVKDPEKEGLCVLAAVIEWDMDVDAVGCNETVPLAVWVCGGVPEAVQVRDWVSEIDTDRDGGAPLALMDKLGVGVIDTVPVDVSDAETVTLIEVDTLIDAEYEPDILGDNVGGGVTAALGEGEYEPETDAEGVTEGL